MKFTQSSEDYFESILVLSNRFGEVYSADVARYLKITKPSVSAAMKKLYQAGCICYSEHGTLILTVNGKKLRKRFMKNIPF